MAREIPLTRGLVAIVDDADFDWLNGWNWAVAGHQLVAGRCENRVTIYMHRVILNAQPGQLVDHVNGDPRDNRRANLRICTFAENSRNARRQTGSRCRYKGVAPSGPRWTARITVDGKQVRLGGYATDEQAARAYDEAARRHHGEFACVNFPKSGERAADEGLTHCVRSDAVNTISHGCPPQPVRVRATLTSPLSVSQRAARTDPTVGAGQPLSSAAHG